MLTGDAAVNADAPIICCTAEILANIALRDGARADVGTVVMDEFHFYADPDRGWAWQVPLIELPQAQFLLMSATLGDVTFFRDDLTRRTGRPTAVVTSVERPGAAALPLRAHARCTRRSTSCCRRTRRRSTSCTSPRPSAVERAQALMSVNVTHARGEAGHRRPDRQLPVHRRLRQDAVAAGAPRDRRAPRRDAAPVPPAGGDPRPGRPAQGHLRHRHPRRRHQRADPHGAVHRAVQVRRRAHARRSRPASSTRSPGGPGRAGFDTVGTVVVQAPEHVVENEPAARQGRRRPEEAPQGRAQEGAGGVRRLVGHDLRAAAERPSPSR